MCGASSAAFGTDARLPVVIAIENESGSFMGSFDRFLLALDKADPIKGWSGTEVTPRRTAGHRERRDKIPTISENPKRTQLPVANMLPSVRVVGCARNALTFFILTKDDGARSAASQKPD